MSKEYEQYLVPSAGSATTQPKEYEKFLMGGTQSLSDPGAAIMNMPEALKGMQMDPETSKYLMEHVIAELGKAALTSWGGNLGSMIPKFPGLGSIAGQAAGQFTGEIARQKLMGEQPDIGAAGKESAIVGGTGLGILGLARTASAMGGIGGKDYAEAVKRPVLTRGAPREAELNIAENVNVDISGRGLTAGKLKLNLMVEAADAAGKKIDAIPLLDSVESHIGQGVEKGNASVDTMLRGMRARLLNRVIKASPDGMLKPSEFNKIVEEEFTAPLHEYYQRPGGTKYLNRLAKIREQAAQYLYDNLEPGAKSAAGLAHGELRTRETLKNLLPMGEEAKPNLGVGARIQQANEPTNVSSGPILERATKAYDAKYDTDFWKQMNDLRINRQFSPLDPSQTAQIAQLPIIGYEPRSIIQRLSLNVARPAIRLIRSTGGAARSLAASEIERHKREKQTKSPEQSFPGMTNVPQQGSQ